MKNFFIKAFYSILDALILYLIKLNLMGNALKIVDGVRWK